VVTTTKEVVTTELTEEQIRVLRDRFGIKTSKQSRNKPTSGDTGDSGAGSLAVPQTANPNPKP